jgi:uncharacterized membrane protein
MTGLTAVALTTPPDRRRDWVARFGSRWGRVLTVLRALGEIVADKSPKVPSRLAPPGLGPRIVLGGLAAAALARREGEPAAVPVALAIAAAVGASVVGARWRAYVHERGGSTLASAVAEDLIVVGLATMAAAPSRVGR